MKRALLSVAFVLSVAAGARADLTIIQKVNGMGRADQDVTIRIKGDKARIDATPEISSIIDSKTGDIVTLLNTQKTVVHISASKMKAAAEMIDKFNDKKASASAAPAKPQPTGRKETINGLETEEYAVATPTFKAAFWLAPGYPDGAAILKQLKAVKSGIWSSANSNVMDYRDFPALPIRTVIDMGNTKLTTTLVSVKQESLSDALFAVPKDFRELKTPVVQPDQDDAEDKESPHP